MSGQTRTITVAFAGGEMRPLPGGRFLFIKSATGALDVTLRGARGTDSVLQQIGAGSRVKRLDGEAWRITEITSATPQSVVIVLSDDSEFDVASTVTVAGAVSVADLPAVSVTDTADTTQASGTQTTISQNLSRRRITIGVLSTSAEGVRVSQSGGANTRGDEIQPGMKAEWRNTAALIVRNANVGGSGGNAVWYAEEEA